LNNFN